MAATNDRRRNSGFRNARIREAQMLPLGWRHLTGVDIIQLRETVTSLAGPKASLETLEACLLLWSSLVTGRQAVDLLSLKMHMAKLGDQLKDTPYGLVHQGGRWGWWLAAGAPPGQTRKFTAMRPTATGIYLPTTRIVAELISRCGDIRRKSSGAKFLQSGVAEPLFASDHANLLTRLKNILASRHPLDSARSRKATTTPEALARWLPAEMMGAAGGDIVPASILTGRLAKTAETPIHYGAVGNEWLFKKYKAAIAQVDLPAHEHIPPEAVVAHLGDRLTPTDKAVRGLVHELSANLDDPSLDLAEQHEAMTRYTVAVLCFALAHRGDVGTMPALNEVDEGTRFAWIYDKIAGGQPTRRLVWICNIAFEQLCLYNAHLDRVRCSVSDHAGAMIDRVRSMSGLPLIDLTSGVAKPLPVHAAARRAFDAAGLPKNAGRHWLRAALVGRCSGETLHALFGHGMIGSGSWDEISALDPAMYRADLARVMDPALDSVGWHPRGPGAAS